MSFWKQLFHEEDGQDMVEYGLIIGLVVLACVTAYTALGGSISTGINNTSTEVGKAMVAK
jgi:pilus assembly protein Flp/PilA